MRISILRGLAILATLIGSQSFAMSEVAPRQCSLNFPDGVYYAKIAYTRDGYFSLDNLDGKTPEEIIGQKYPGGRVLKVEAEWMGSNGPHALIYFCRL